MRACLLCLLGSTGCGLLFPLEHRADAPTDTLDLTPEGVQTPALFEGRVQLEGSYLLEGSGFVFESMPGSLPVVHPGVPIFLGGVAPATSVSLVIPSGVGDGWEVCGDAVSAGTVDLGSLITPPCIRGATSLAFTLAVPVSATFDTADSPVQLELIVDGQVFGIPVMPLDEARQSTLTLPSQGLFSAIIVDAPWVPARETLVDLAAVSTIEIASAIDAAGTAGQSNVSNACPNGCSGGLSGAGGGGGGFSNCGPTALECPGGAPRGGEGGRLCNTGGFCQGFRAAHGAGAGNALAGNDGQIGQGGGCNTTTAIGGLVATDPRLVDVTTAGGGGGGAGANINGGVAGNSFTLFGGGGGGGGGVVVLETLGQLVLGAGGSIDVRGGNGGTAAQATAACTGNPVQASGTGGGGAGGAIRLLAGALAVDGSLAAKLDLAGGDASQTPNSAGGGGRGRLRIDAPETGDLVTGPGLARGPDFDVPSSIVTTETLDLSVRTGTPDLGGELHWGVRASGATEYVTNLTLHGAASTASISVPLAQGLNEICVFAVAPVSTKVSDFGSGTRRCAWVARVAPD